MTNSLPTKAVAVRLAALLVTFVKVNPYKNRGTRKVRPRFLYIVELKKATSLIHALPVLNL
ncbi:hypothetical protein BH23PAT2_BH23PAT2_10190 [soil metagenome]